jgi:hypothetical protein
MVARKRSGRSVDGQSKHGCSLGRMKFSYTQLSFKATAMKKWS